MTSKRSTVRMCARDAMQDPQNSLICYCLVALAIYRSRAKDTNCSTRLETRTKEFNSNASCSVPTKHTYGEAKAM